MYGAILLVIVGFAAVMAEEVPQDFKKCSRLGTPGAFHCCKKPPMKPKEDFNDLRECFDKMEPPPSCAHEICIATKKGFSSSDGKIDKKALQDIIEKEFDMPELVTAIKKNCIDEDISKYGPPDFCDLMKLRHCTHLQYALHCSEWEDSGHCTGLAALAEECKKLM